MFKARVAISSMGSSVIHGGISTFLAVLVLSMAKSYIFVVFFKLWFGIVVFGMSNGFILLPIILSFVGPTPNLQDKKVVKERRLSRRLSLTPAGIAQVKDGAGGPQKSKIDPEAGDATDQPKPAIPDQVELS